jgi:hypothetical protein
MDPLAEGTEDITPYHYCLNNPIANIDPTGMWTVTANGYSTNDPDEIAAFMQQMEGGQKRSQSSNENGDKDPPKKDSKTKGNSTNNNRPWYSIYNWPGAGASAETMDAIYDGRYGDAALWFLVCAGEVFTLGYATEIQLGGQTIKLTVSAAKSGVTVLGSYDAVTGGYIAVAEKMGANYFNIPKNIWSKMSPAEQWAANVKFLDRAIARGDKIVLSNSAFKAQAGTSFYKELQYMFSKGYKVAADGMALIKNQ